MKNQMKNKYCLDEKDWQKAKAALPVAEKRGNLLRNRGRGCIYCF